MNLPAADHETLPILTDDGHRFHLLLVRAPQPIATVLWSPALGVAARHYLPLAHALSRHGYNVAMHEWRGIGSSSLRASRQNDWGFGQLLEYDYPASLSALHERDLYPTIAGGHSLGGQLSTCLVALHPAIQQLWLVASGSPYWRSFPPRLQLTLPLSYSVIPIIAQLFGYLPGHRLGFGGREARTLIRHWAAVGRQGHYRHPAEVENAMSDWQGHCHGIVLQNDWMAPASSLLALQEKLPQASCEQTLIVPGIQDTKADHFHWIRYPEHIAQHLANHAKKISQNR